MAEQPKKILDQLRDVLRLRHYSYRTEQSYVDWVYRFIVFLLDDNYPHSSMSIT